MNNVLQFFLQGVAGQGHQVFVNFDLTIWWRIFWDYFYLSSTEVNNWWRARSFYLEQDHSTLRA